MVEPRRGRAVLGERFADALALGARLHARKVRRGTDIPYVAHLLAVVSLVLEDGGDEDEAIAALLHDAVEDPGGQAAREEIGRRFGERVLRLVDACTDVTLIPVPPWRQRKEAQLRRLTLAGADVLRVVGAWTLQRARVLLADVCAIGDGVWRRLDAGRADQLWYYRALLEVLETRRGRGAPVEELARVVAALEEAVGGPPAAAPCAVPSGRGVGRLRRDWSRLASFLARSGAPRVVLTFEEIETIIGAGLPPTARRHRAYWADAGHAHARAWRSAGYRVTRAGLGAGEVGFLRSRSYPGELAAAVAPPPGAGAGHGAAREGLAGFPGARPAAPRGPRADPVEARAEGSRRGVTIVLVGPADGGGSPAVGPAVDRGAPSLFEARCAYAAASGRPWTVLGASREAVEPGAAPGPDGPGPVGSTGSGHERWASRAIAQLAARFGSLAGLTFEVHADGEHVSALEAPLAVRGADLRRPLDGLSPGEQLRWYAAAAPGREPASPADAVGKIPSGPPASRTGHGGGRRPIRAGRGLARCITEAFHLGRLDLSARPDALEPGWGGLPEVRAAARLRALGATDAAVRLFVTFVASLARASDAGRLWDDAAGLYEAEPWAFQPEEVLRRPLGALADALWEARVSGRHAAADSAGWRLVAEALCGPRPEPRVRRAVLGGEGDARILLDAVRVPAALALPQLPALRSARIGSGWIRMLAYPGRARIDSLAAVPVGIDARVRRLSEYLGVAKTAGLPPDEVCGLLQEAWRADVEARGAVGPASLAGTRAALDPALRFYARWGCGTCERAGRRLPVSAACDGCRLDVIGSKGAGDGFARGRGPR